MKALRAPVAKAVWVPLLWAVPALAAEPGAEGPGVLTVLFLAFGALIVAAQAVPAAVMFASMIRALFAGRAGEGVREEARKVA
ncbi:MAG: hypothetical protein Kow0092_39130 [Deferrisomatales bacterium]